MNPRRGPEAVEPAAPEALDIPMIDGALDALFRQIPAPSVIALGQDGLRVPMPPHVPVAPEQVIDEVSSPLVLFVPADQALAVEAWERVHKTKGAQAALHLRSDPQHTVMLTLVDARHRYGVFLAFISSKIGVIPNGAPAGQSVFHVHFHIIPRADGVDMGLHARGMVDAKTLEPVAAKIRSAL